MELPADSCTTEETLRFTVNCQEQKEMESIDHFSHQHPLDPWKLTGEGKNKCSACELLCMEQSYGCEKCGFFLHKKCAELPRELPHPLHPRHPLKLFDTANYLGQFFYCDFCQKRSRGFTFRCKECDFDLDIGCALTARPEVKTISHFSHEHQLTLEKDAIVQEVWCKACEKRCLNAAYVCEKCSYFLHKSCAELPAEWDHPLHKSHKLKLQTTAYDDGPVWCDYCENRVLGFIYHCERCKYDLDVECARMHIFVAQEQIKHFGDMHTLVLSEKKEEDKVLCGACQESCAGDTFGCERCEFFLHRSCAELPEEMDNPFHEGHPLKLQAAFSNVCDSCNSGIHGYTYRCDQCDFDLDVKCALKLASKPNEEIQHFAHKLHKLKSSLKTGKGGYSCRACDKYCSGLVYGCDQCEFFLHESCAELPPVFSHYFHEHDLTLQPQVESKDQMTCRACEKRIGGFTYSCLECRFHMDVECTLMVERKRRAGYIEHICHGHPLKLLFKRESELCSACKKQLSGRMYGCNRCRIWLHRSCAAYIQKQIDHFFHRHKDQKLLFKTQVRNKKCKACMKGIQGLTFQCEGCDFNLDAACALMPRTMPQGHKFLGHGHPLKLIEIDSETGISCSVCEKPCDGPTYNCGPCIFHVHKACGELQEKTISDIHPKHSMELKTKDRFKCAACLKESSGFTYECTVCSQISLHVGCKDVKPLIKYEGHPHPLAFFKSVYEKEELPCKARGCGSEIPSSSEKQRDNVVRCADCNYNLHLICGPLPSVIDSKNHKHPLVLRNKFVVEGSDESYCDACEKERDPSECVYKCARCPYVAAFDCMKAEVIELLQGKENHVELRSLGEGFTGEVITEGIEATEMLQKKRAEGDGLATDVKEVYIVGSLDDLLDSFIGDEDIKLTGSVEFLEKEMTDLQGGISRIFPDVSSYPYKALKELMARLETSVREAEFSMIFFEKEEIGEVEEFMTIKSLVPTLKQLLHRHKDIIKRSDQRSESKSLVITMLCGAIQSMVQFEGQINNISETLLFNWWNHFMLAKCAGFDVQFLMGHLKDITMAFFALKAKEVQERKLQELAGKIGESENIFSDMEEKLKEISREEVRILANSSGSGSFEEPRVEPELLEKKVLGVVANELQ